MLMPEEREVLGGHVKSQLQSVKNHFYVQKILKAEND